MRATDAGNPWALPTWAAGSAPAQEAGGGYEPASEDVLCQFVNDTCWKAWLPAYRNYRRQVEENVRMLSGRHYDAFVNTLGEFVDLSDYFTSADQRWRQNPVFNWTAHYYKLTLSKLTENLPTVGFLPGGADFADATLAQIMEPVWRYELTQMRMHERMYLVYGWVIAAARSITKLRWDPDRGPKEEFRGPAIFEQFRQNVLTSRTLTDAPYVRKNDGTFAPAFLYGADGEPQLDDQGEPQFGQPYTSRLGDLAFSVHSPTSVITPLGPEPFDEKPWFTHEYLVPVEEARRRFGVENLEPDELSGEDDLSLLLDYGTNYGMPSHATTGISLGVLDNISLKGLIRIREHWRMERPNHPTLSKGRLLCVSRDRVLYDDINPFWVDGTHEQAVNPFDAFDAVPVPFRREGMGDLEQINPLNRALNRRMAGAMDAVDYNEQPITFYNENTVSEEYADQFNRPGAYIPANMIPSLGPPAHRLPPADLPRSSVDMARMLQEWMQLLGSQPFGSEGVPVTTDASGELQREVRFDTDRVWGATIRLHSYIWARIAEKVGHILCACMDDERLMILAGEDSAPEFVTVAPEMFQGRVQAYPQPESQVLESRQEKQNRIMALVGVGLPLEQALKALNYPDLNRVLRPGGPAYSMAQRENLEMMLGVAPPVLLEHDHATHLLLHKQQQQTVAYRDADPAVQHAFTVHILMHEEMQAAEAIRQGLLANAVAGALMPPMPPEGGGGEDGDADEGAGGALAQPAGRAPKGSELERGAVTPGAADPRHAALRLSR